MPRVLVRNLTKGYDELTVGAWQGFTYWLHHHMRTVSSPLGVKMHIFGIMGYRRIQRRGNRCNDGSGKDDNVIHRNRRDVPVRVVKP